MLYPAIDIKGGRAVRLLKGQADAVTDYGDPVAAALRWKAEGAAYLHVVDLDGAFAGSGRNGEIVARIVQETGLPVQLGGGVRSLDDIEDRLRLGVARVILGTVALEQPELVAQACRRFPRRIVCGIDAKAGRVSVRGWVRDAPTTPQALALQMKEAGVSTIIYTDIGRDGTLSGPNLAATQQLAQQTGMEVIGSGGVGSLDDVRGLLEAGCGGVILGKALYSGAFSLPEALQVEEEWNATR